MEAKHFCQSCTLPIDNVEDRGTEKDGSKSELYCKYCYRDGLFTDPGMTLERMTGIAKAEMTKLKLPNSLIQQSIDMLPNLKRWKVSVASPQSSVVSHQSSVSQSPKF